MPFETQHLENEPAARHWPAPLTLFIAWLTALLASITKLNRIRATTRFKPTWRDSWPGLRESEWHRCQMLAQGAALLLAGKTLNDAGYENLPMPDDFGGPCPKTPFEMKRRFAVIADWLRDPEAHIHRHAARIARAAHGSTDAALGAAARHEAMDVAGSENAQDALVASSALSARQVYAGPVEGSNHEGGLPNARAPPKIPPKQALPHASAPLPATARSHPHVRALTLPPHPPT